MLSLCGERLTSKVLDHYLHHDLIMLQLVFFGSFTHLRRPRSPPKFNVLHCTTQDISIKFHPNPFITF